MSVTLPTELEKLLAGTPELARAYLVGGCVRDALLGRTVKDFDVEVFGVSYAGLERALRRWGRVDLVGRSFGVVKLTTGSGLAYDFAIPRRDRKVTPGHKGFEVEFDADITPAEAASRRDFTINALMFDPHRGEVLDFFGGKNDLGARVLRHTSAAFVEDPLRVLRGMQFAARFDFTAAPETLALCREIRASYSELAVERVREELRNGNSLFLMQPTDVAERATRTIIGRMILGALFAIVLAMLVVSVYTRRATRPIKRAVRAAEHMAEGARDVRLPQGGVAEFADLATSMNELSDALARSEDRQRQFLLSVSHELRTPLTAIGGYTEALADGVVDPDDVPEIAAIMRSESERLQRLVSDLLDLSRAGAVELRLTPTDVDMSALIVEAGQVWNDRCEREGVVFRLVTPARPLHITTDALRVRQIIDNLCENALRVTPAGGRVAVTAAGTAAAGADGDHRQTAAAKRCT